MAITANRIAISSNEIANDSNQLVQYQIELQEKELIIEEYINDPQFKLVEKTYDRNLQSILSNVSKEINLLTINSDSLREIYNHNNHKFEEIFTYIYNSQFTPDFYCNESLDSTDIINYKIHYINSILHTKNFKYVIQNTGADVAYVKLEISTRLYIRIAEQKDKLIFSFPITNYYYQDTPDGLYTDNIITFYSLDELYLSQLGKSIVRKLKEKLPQKNCASYVETCLCFIFPSYNSEIREKYYRLNRDSYVIEEIDDILFCSSYDFGGDSIYLNDTYYSTDMVETIDNVVEFIIDNCK